MFLWERVTHSSTSEGSGVTFREKKGKGREKRDRGGEKKALGSRGSNREGKVDAGGGGRETVEKKKKLEGGTKQAGDSHGFWGKAKPDMKGVISNGGVETGKQG